MPPLIDNFKKKYYNNYVIENTIVIIKYKTALVNSTYYTIEDAFALGSGTITFAFDN